MPSVMKISLLMLEDNVSSWKLYWREDPSILKMNRKQLQLWLFVGAKLKENLVFCNFCFVQQQGV